VEKLRNEERHDLYSSPIVVRVINSRRMRWTGPYHVWGERRVQGFSGGKLEGKRPPGNPGVDGRRILRWIFRMWGYGLDRAGSG
jgi:hypothetical protein